MAKHRLQTQTTRQQFVNDFLNGVGRGLIIAAVFVLVLIYGHYL
jgi:hypothetical protein